MRVTLITGRRFQGRGTLFEGVCGREECGMRLDSRLRAGRRRSGTDGDPKERTPPPRCPASQGRINTRHRVLSDNLLPLPEGEQGSPSLEHTPDIYSFIWI